MLLGNKKGNKKGRKYIFTFLPKFKTSKIIERHSLIMGISYLFFVSSFQL